ncbi:MAG: homoserine kinase, partial [Microcoleus sp. SIO2G3]|nr:homoserine kinase [Microcoleus sp. SIO2G3]
SIFNVAHLGLLLRGLEAGRTDWLRVALQDRIHQPYRKILIRGYDAIEQAAIDSGACGLVISGAGPTLLALATIDRAAAVAAAIDQAWQAEGVKPQVQQLAIDSQGAQISAS